MMLPVAAPGTADWHTSVFSLILSEEKGGGARTCPCSLRNLLRALSVQHGVQLVSEVIKHVANVVQDGPC